MKIKHILPLFALSTAYGATVNISSWDNGSGQAFANGTSVTFSATSDESGGSWINWDFTITGDLDGLGDAVDTLSFRIQERYYTGGSYDSSSGVFTSGNNGFTSVSNDAVTGNTLHFGDNLNGSGYLNVGDSILLSGPFAVNYSRGNSYGSTDTVSFDGFSQIGIYTVGGGSGGSYVIGNSANDIGSEVSVTGAALTSITNTTSDLYLASTAGDIRFRDLDFSFTVSDSIPEPSSTALIGLGCLALVTRRKR